jgi:hypothetical protein
MATAAEIGKGAASLDQLVEAFGPPTSSSRARKPRPTAGKLRHWKEGAPPNLSPTPPDRDDDIVEEKQRKSKKQEEPEQPTPTGVFPLKPEPLRGPKIISVPIDEPTKNSAAIKKPKIVLSPIDQLPPQMAERVKRLMSHPNYLTLYIGVRERLEWARYHEVVDTLPRAERELGVITTEQLQENLWASRRERFKAQIEAIEALPENRRFADIDFLFNTQINPKVRCRRARQHPLFNKLAPRTRLALAKNEERGICGFIRTFVDAMQARFEMKPLPEKADLGQLKQAIVGIKTAHASAVRREHPASSLKRKSGRHGKNHKDPQPVRQETNKTSKLTDAEKKAARKAAAAGAR